ncbi:hypothetical protein [Alteribacillus sp. YIM 98480]|uniref:hypothetical protein n=1 Tax=Alteribacillus sp. YIM 98480 TaxID=2606599 RepID=UPI00131CC573|nr:hypothetical protein [Alteribacillus sp. YIM 98480]
MKNIAILFISFVFLMAGCMQDNQNDERTALKDDDNNHHEEELIKKNEKQNSEEFKGIVEDKRKIGDFHQLLVHPGNSNGPTHFAVNKKRFDQIEIGKKVIVRYDPEGIVYYSGIPQREADEVIILSDK